MRILAIHDVLLSVEEPCRNFELSWVLNDSNKAFEFIRVKLASAGDHAFELTLQGNQDWKALPFVEVDVRFFTNNVRIATANTLDLGQGIHNFALSVNIGVQ